MPKQAVQLGMKLEDIVTPQDAAALPERSRTTVLQVADKFQHIDGDQFYVSIERVKHPKLEGKPVVIRYKSIVSATSYEARTLGIKAGIPFSARGSLEATAEALTGAVIMACSRMQVRNYSGDTLTVGIRHSDSGGMDRTAQQKLNSYTNSEETMAVRAVAMLTRLYREAAAEGMIVNRVGVKVSGIRADMPAQLELAKI